MKSAAFCAWLAAVKIARRSMPAHVVFYRKQHDAIINHLLAGPAAAPLAASADGPVATPLAAPSAFYDVVPDGRINTRHVLVDLAVVDAVPAPSPPAGRAAGAPTQHPGTQVADRAHDGSGAQA